MNIKLTVFVLSFFILSPVIAHEANSLPYGPFLGGITHPVLGFDHLTRAKSYHLRTI